MKKTLLTMACLALAASASHAAVIISEVNPAGSSSSYGADWFELTNTGAAALDITGWKMDDNSASFALSVPLRGVTSIAPGQSVVFTEGTAAGTTDATIQANFKTAWFGTNVPAGFTIGGYGGSGIGLSSVTDGVNIYDSLGNVQATVSFSATPTGATFDNAAGVNGVIAQASVVGVNGAFTSANGNEIGSPGAIPEPSSAALLLLGLAGLAHRRRNS